jgi:hypothetical protein
MILSGVQEPSQAPRDIHFVEIDQQTGLNIKQFPEATEEAKAFVGDSPLPMRRSLIPRWADGLPIILQAHSGFNSTFTRVIFPSQLNLQAGGLHVLNVVEPGALNAGHSPLFSRFCPSTILCQP